MTRNGARARRKAPPVDLYVLFYKRAGERSWARRDTTSIHFAKNDRANLIMFPGIYRSITLWHYPPNAKPKRIK